MFRLIRCVNQNQTGQALVELALVLPILIFLLLAIMEGGRIFAGYLELQNAARDGARYTSVHYKEDLESVTEVEDWRDGTLTPWIQARLSILDSTNITIPISFETEPARSNPTNPVKTDPDKQEWVEIRLHYPLDIITPVISSILGSTVDLNVKMSMRLE